MWAGVILFILYNFFNFTSKTSSIFIQSRTSTSIKHQDIEEKRKNLINDRIYFTKKQKEFLLNSRHNCTWMTEELDLEDEKKKYIENKYKHTVRPCNQAAQHIAKAHPDRTMMFVNRPVPNDPTYDLSVLSYTPATGRLSLPVDCAVTAALSTQAWGEDIFPEIRGAATTDPLPGALLLTTLSRDDAGTCFVDLWTH